MSLGSTTSEFHARTAPGSGTRPTKRGNFHRSTASRWLRPALPLLPAAVMLAMGLWRLQGRGPWRDEAATYGVALRSWSEIGHLIQHVDAVHGLYYLLMHGIFLVFGDSLAALRLPSVLAMAAAAGGVAAIGRRLAGPAVGTAAGLLLAVIPFASEYAQEGRSYALVTAGVVLATLLLLRAWERPTAWRWTAYASVLLMVGLLHEFALLMLPVHGIVVLLTRRPRAPRAVRAGWLLSAAAAALGALPLALYSRTQSLQVSWLPPVTWDTPVDLLKEFSGPAPGVMAAVLGLAALGTAVPARRPSGAAGPGLRILALPWLLLPPALLMSASLSTPLYYDRYVLYSLPGLLLLTAAGLDGAVRGAIRLLAAVAPQAHRQAWRTGAVAVLGVALAASLLMAQLPLQRRDRTSLARADDFRAAARLLGRSAEPGDAVVYVPAVRREIEYIYPREFRNTTDVLQTSSPARSGTLGGHQAPPERVQSLILEHDRVWLVMTGDAQTQPEVFRTLAKYYRAAQRSHTRGFIVDLFVRR